MSKKWAMIYIACLVVFALQIKKGPENDLSSAICSIVPAIHDLKADIKPEDLQKELEKMKLENKKLRALIKLPPVRVY